MIYEQEEVTPGERAGALLLDKKGITRGKLTLTVADPCKPWDGRHVHDQVKGREATSESC